MLDVIPVLDVGVLLELGVRATVSAAGETAVTRATRLTATGPHTAPNRAPALVVVGSQRVACHWNLANRREDRILRGNPAVILGAAVVVDGREGRGRHLVLERLLYKPSPSGIRFQTGTTSNLDFLGNVSVSFEDTTRGLWLTSVSGMCFHFLAEYVVLI